jgi:hypothetical protein
VAGRLLRLLAQGALRNLGGSPSISVQPHRAATHSGQQAGATARCRGRPFEPGIPPPPQALPTFKNPQCYTNTVWALANWRHLPGQAWLDALCTAGLPYLQQLDSAQLPIFICSLAQLQHHPGHNLACYLLECLHRQHRNLTPKNLAACIGALAQLIQPPGSPETWQPHRKFVVQYAPLLADLAGACRAGLGRMDSKDLCALAEGFAGLRYFPGDAFMVRHEQLCNARVTDLSVYQITSLKRAYQRLDEVHQREYGGAAAGAPGGQGGLLA